MSLRWLLIFALVSTPALGQQQMIPLTGWRAEIDQQLGDINMTRKAHGEIMGILQQWERKAQAEKAKEESK